MVTITDEARGYMGVFAEVTDVTPTDCVVDDDHDRLLVVVPPGQKGAAVGHGGGRVEAVERRVGRTVSLVEDADEPERLVANALAPAVVHGVTVSEGGPEDPTVAYAQVDEADRGVAIGRDGATIDGARLLAERHFDVEDVQLA
jgi:N utilization substance protein A